MKGWKKIKEDGRRDWSYARYKEKWDLEYGIEVANVNFVYNNGLLIKRLMERADAKTASAKFEKEKEMNGLVKKNLSEFRTPLSAFVTFTNQEAKERCSKFYCTKDAVTGKNNPDY
jgi:hypothetical protein